MTEEEIKGLIPFYVAGTLAPDQKKAVEDALMREPGLKGELRFWQQAQKAVLFTAEDAQHLSSEQIVDFAENQIEERDRKAIELHLGSCPSCNAELEAIGGVKHPSQTGSNAPKWLKGIIEMLKGIRPTYALVGLAIMITLFLVLKPQKSEPPEQASIPRQTDSTAHHLPTAAPRKFAALTLMYQSITRGSTKTEPPSIGLDSSTTDLLLTIQIPRSGIARVEYVVTVTRGSGDSVFVRAKVLPKPLDSSSDIIALTVSTSQLRRPGLYAVVALETIPGDIHEITPESYHYEFMVVPLGPVPP